MTTLNVALSSAVSSLLIIEKQMSVTSNNIANANTAGYSRETVQVGEAVTGGVGSGVRDLGTISNVDQFMQAAMLQSNMQSADATAYNTLYQNLQNAFGQVSANDTGGNDLSSQISTLQTALSTLATTPQNSAQATNVVQSLDNLTVSLRSISGQVQQLRTTADTQIGQAVGDANTQLDTINDLNKQIEQASAQGQSTAALSDLRTNALKSLSGDLGVTYYVDGTGAMQVFTTSGQTLLVGDTANHLSHTPVSIGQNSSYPNGGIGGIMIGNADITKLISSGSIAGLVKQRDTELPNAQSGLDTLAQRLAATVNNVYNLATAPAAPPASATGTNSTPMALADAVTVAAGTKLRVALLDNPSGDVGSYCDVTLTAGASTVGQVIDDINTQLAAANPPMAAVATLNSSGQLDLRSTSTSATPPGINIASLSGTLSTTGTTPTDFGSYFSIPPTGPNQLLTSGTATSMISASNIQVRSDILAQPNKMSIGNGSMATMLGDTLLNAQTFNLSIVSPIAQADSVSALGLNGIFTINGGSAPVTVSVTAGQSLQDIANAINAAGASVTASLQGTAPARLEIDTGTQTSLSFSAVSGNVLSSLGIPVSPSGYLGGTTTTFAGFAGSLISDIATRANNANTDATTKSTTATAMAGNLSSQSGVNTDEEMARLTSLQSSYASSAKIISTVQAMFTSLIQAVG